MAILPLWLKFIINFEAVTCLNEWWKLVQQDYYYSVEKDTMLCQH